MDVGWGTGDPMEAPVRTVALELAGVAGGPSGVGRRPQVVRPGSLGVGVVQSQDA